jgi:hypothetical protein
MTNLRSETDWLDPMTVEPVDPGASARRSRRRWIAALFAVVIGPVALVGALMLAGSTYFSDPLNSEPVSADVMAEEFGIRVDLVAVTAAGGVVDVRFTVLDPEKAGHLLHDDASMPTLIVENNDSVIRIRSIHRHNDLTTLERSSYFILYPNPGGFVQGGSEVSVVIDGLRLEHLIAQT